MSGDADYIRRIEEAKLILRRDLVKLPYEEKIKRMIEMQKFSRDFRKDKTKEVFVWEID